MNPPIVSPQVDCKSAQEFIAALSPLGEYFRDVKLGEPWLFRGQGKDHPLIPSAFRENGKLQLFTHRNVRDYQQRLLAERDILVQFFEIADRRGLMLPDDSQQLRSDLEILMSERGDQLIGRGYSEWQPTNHALSLVALAQHHGIPTRLLDWTKQPFIAAFFAAESALSSSNENGQLDRMVVWTFHFPIFGKHDQLSQLTDPIRIVTAPSATNSNLKAQQGVFTLLNSFYTKEAEDDYPPLDKFLEALALKWSPKESPVAKLVSSCRLRKFTLPASEASQVLYLLAKLDITASVVYPGYQSIMVDMQLQNQWMQLHR